MEILSFEELVFLPRAEAATRVLVRKLPEIAGMYLRDINTASEEERITLRRDLRRIALGLLAVEAERIAGEERKALERVQSL